MKALRIAVLATVVLFAALGSAPALAARGGGGGGSHGGGGGWHGGGGGWHGGGWHGHSGWHGSVGVYFGGWYPYYGYPYYAGYPYYGYPYPYSLAYYPPYGYPGAAYAAPAYVERGAAQPEANWWYYCADSKGYYPYVQECPSGWSRVSPQPPS